MEIVHRSFKILSFFSDFLISMNKVNTDYQIVSKYDNFLIFSRAVDNNVRGT